MNLQLNELSVHIGSRPILHSLCCELLEGQSLAIMGPSGSGKTTLARTVLGFSREYSIRGSIAFGGELLQKDNQLLTNLSARRFAYIPQGLSPWPHLSVQKTLSLALCFAKVDYELDELLELFALRAHKNHMPQELSGGQRQRLALVCALAAKPRLVIFDEAFSALDPIAKDELIKIIKNWQQKINFSALIITHDLREAFMIAEQILILDQGKKIWQGPKNQLQNAESTYAQKLLAREHGWLQATLP